MEEVNYTTRMNADYLGRELAEVVIQKLEMEAFIRWWNDGQPYGTLIGSIDHMHAALGFDENLRNSYDNVYKQAVFHNVEEDFMAWTSALITPTICSTFIEAALNASSLWVLALIRKGPQEFGLCAPFSHIEILVKWFLSNIERPPFAGPTGEVIIIDAVEELLLRQALRAEIPALIGYGWLHHL